jgi:hypothetical protein
LTVLDPRRLRMQTVPGTTRVDTVGCGEVEGMNLADTSECCERCHSADRPGSLGPCRTKVPDGREAFVCCAVKKRLLERRSGKKGRGLS